MFNLWKKLFGSKDAAPKEVPFEDREVRVDPSLDLNAFDLDNLEEASRQMSAATGQTPQKCYVQLLALGKRMGKVPEDANVPNRIYPVKACLNCGEPKRHRKPFCSATCHNQYKTMSEYRDKNGIVLRVGDAVLAGGKTTATVTLLFMSEGVRCVRTKVGTWATNKVERLG